MAVSLQHMNAFAGDLQHRAAARLGLVLRDKWRLERLLGLGGMAAVYLATHRNGKQVAIKILHPEAALVPDIKARFLREGYLANKVGHPGAVSILDDDTAEDGSVFLVMELLTGETLDARWAREGTLKWDLALAIAYKVLDVLCAAHDKNIVHRDLKPANIFLDSTGSVKILDFGIARLQSLGNVSHTTLRDTALGTPGFMPPEQARGHWDRVDAQSDIWAIGANMFALISGRHVHEAPTINEQLLAAMTMPAAPLNEVAPDVPPEIASLVDRALSFEKNERFASANAMKGELRAEYEALTGQTIEQALPVPVLPRVSLRISDAATMAATLNETSTARSLGRETANPRKWRGATRYTLFAALLAGAVATIGLSAKRYTAAEAAPQHLGASITHATLPSIPDEPPLDTATPAAPVELPKGLETSQAKSEALQQIEPQAIKVPRQSALRPKLVTPKPARKALKPTAAASTQKTAASARTSPKPPNDDDFFDRRK